MSVMCKMKTCKLNGQSCAEKGLCIHEKMMLGGMMLGVLVATAHWVLHWF